MSFVAINVKFSEHQLAFVLPENAIGYDINAVQIYSVNECINRLLFKDWTKVFPMPYSLAWSIVQTTHVKDWAKSNLQIPDEFAIMNYQVSANEPRFVENAFNGSVCCTPTACRKRYTQKQILAMNLKLDVYCPIPSSMAESIYAGYLSTQWQYEIA